MTNVLEGLGLFKKTAKNRVGWIAEGNIKDLQMFHAPVDPNDPKGPYMELIDEPYFFYDPEVIKFLDENDMSESGFQKSEIQLKQDVDKLTKEIQDLEENNEILT